jgi:chloramphenicol-sensitive protein RarD
VALLMAGGVLTAIPLVLFSAATIRIPLATVGVLQYITPSMQFLIGVLVDHEPLPLARLLGFALVWTALAVFTADAVRAARRAHLARDDEHVEPARPVDALDAVELDVGGRRRA